MLNLVAHAHGLICATCVTPCAWQSDPAKHADPQLSCPLGHWHGWGANPAPVSLPQSKHGVGTVLTALLKKLKCKPIAGCQCRQRARQMNAAGVEWCEQNIDIIVEWLREEYTRSEAAGLLPKIPLTSKSIPFIVPVAKKVIQRAIAITRARAKTH